MGKGWPHTHAAPQEAKHGLARLQEMHEWSMHLSRNAVGDLLSEPESSRPPLCSICLLPGTRKTRLFGLFASRMGADGKWGGFNWTVAMGRTVQNHRFGLVVMRLDGRGRLKYVNCGITRGELSRQTDKQSSHVQRFDGFPAAIPFPVHRFFGWAARSRLDSLPPSVWADQAREWQ